MQTVATNHEEIAEEVLERLKLLQVARGDPAPFWRWFWEERGRFLFGVAGALLVYSEVRSRPETWTLLMGMIMLVVALWSGRDKSSRRLDALVRFLDRKGQLAVADAGMRDEPSA